MQPPTEQRPSRVRRRRPHPNVYRPSTNLAPFPYLSQEERERRWGLLRAAMEEARVDCLIVPPSGASLSGLSATTRYLTHVGAAGVDVSMVFPLLQEPAAITPDAALWSASQPWCTDLRHARPSHAAAMLVKLREIGLRRGRVGIFGLGADGSGGDAPAGFLRTLAEALPRVTLVDFTEPLRRMRAHKSVEEVAFLLQSACIVDAAYEALAAAVKLDRLELDVWAEVAETLCRLGSELPIRQRWASDPAVSRLTDMLPDGRVQRSWLRLTEIEAAWGGYRARGRQPVALGPPDPACAELFALAVEGWYAAFQVLGPGVHLSAVQQKVETASALTAASHRFGADLTCRAVVRGCGLGADEPILNRASGDVDHVLEPGDCFSLSTVVESSHRWMTWGDSVVVTQRGAERLGTAETRVRVKDA